MAKPVLCYGDSITWGFNPADGSRFSFEQRWPGVLQAALGTGFRIVEEGLNGCATRCGPCRSRPRGWPAECPRCC